MSTQRDRAQSSWTTSSHWCFRRSRCSSRCKSPSQLARTGPANKPPASGKNITSPTCHDWYCKLVHRSTVTAAESDTSHGGTGSARRTPFWFRKPAGNGTDVFVEPGGPVTMATSLEVLTYARDWFPLQEANSEYQRRENSSGANVCVPVTALNGTPSS